MTDNLPAEQEPKQLSHAEQQRRRMDALMQAVEQRSDMLVTLLRDTGIGFDRFREVLKRAIIKGQEKPATNLLLADAGSVIQACIDACTAGLLPDGKQGAIVIYNVNVAERGQPKQWVKKAQFIPMYEGLLNIAYATKNFQSIMATVVYDVDEWDYELGITPWIKHKPGPRPAVAKPDNAAAGWMPYQVVAAYAVAKTTNGGVFVEVFEPEDIRKVMAVSRATSGPAKDWPEQMARKGPLRRMWKFLPRDQRMDRVLELDDENYDLDQIQAPEEKAPALKTGFAPKPQTAIEQDADMVVDIPMDRDDEEFTPVEPERVVTEGPGGGTADPRGVFPPSDDLDLADGDAGGDEPMPEWPPSFPECIIAYGERLKTCTSWLNIKQAIRSLYKEENWEREAWETHVLAWAWERKVQLGDKTDFGADCYAFVAWLQQPNITPDDVSANLSVLENMPDYKKEKPEVQDWVQRLAKDRGQSK